MPEIEKNGLLKLLGLKSISTPCTGKTDFESLLKNYWGNESGYFVVYLDYKVMIGRYKDEQFNTYENHSLVPKFIQRFRLFNGSKELLLWRKKENIFAGRIRKDNEGHDTDAVDAWQVLCGTDTKSLGNFIRIFEQRGTEIILPFKNISVDNKEQRILIHTRNYIDYNEFGQAGYEDCRFVGFTDKDKNILEGN